VLLGPLQLPQVAASKAGTIIVLHPDSASSAQNAEAIKASVAMCITALGPQSNQRVVVQATGAPASAAASQHLASFHHQITRKCLVFPCCLLHQVLLQFTANPQRKLLQEASSCW
jgi:hypothetical protein